jgi:hypothetical protein
MIIFNTLQEYLKLTRFCFPESTGIQLLSGESCLCQCHPADICCSYPDQRLANAHFYE